MLSISLPAISGQTVTAGAPLNVPLNATDSLGNAVNYSVSVTNSQLTNASVSSPTLTATVPTGNPSIQITVSDPTDNISGTMTFQLFKDLAPDTVNEITTLVNDTSIRGQPFYDGLTFHRVIKGLVIQGGDPNGNGTGGPGYQYDDEFNQNLQFTGAGVLALANSGPDTNGSQFFITGAANPSWNFRYTIFGFMTSGYDILNEIENVPVQANSQGEVSSPVNTITMTSVTTNTDTANGVLRLSLPAGTTGTATVTVTATDSVTNETSSQSFTVTGVQNTSVDPPYLTRPINPIATAANTATTFQIPGFDINGNAIAYTASLTTTNANVAVSVNSSTGAVTLTPSNGVTGVFGLKVGVSAASPASGEATSQDTQIVPVYVSPAAPTGVQLIPAPGSTSTTETNLNNTSGKTLQFTVTGTVANADVTIVADGTPIGDATASGSTTVVTTNGTSTLTVGSHSITATQTLAKQAVSEGNLSTTTDLASTASSAVTVGVYTTPPTFNFTANTVATIGDEYTCQVTTGTDAAGTVAYALSEKPTGMTINASSGLITWTPTSGQVPSAEVIVEATDPAGNTSTRHFTIDVSAGNNAPVLAPASPSLGTLHLNTPLTIALSQFINNGSGTTTVTDADQNAVLGGIALIGMTGSGQWQYSLDGKSYANITSLSASTALLLAHDATLRYTPSGTTASTASITYRAWDATTGTNGGTANLAASSAVGGSTAFSTATDTASLSVSAVTDNLVLTAGSPVLGSTTSSTPLTIPLTGSFINNGAATTTITDSNTSGTTGGIAVIGITGQSTWQYSTDGQNFTDMPSVSPSSALLLAATDQLRFQPDGSKSEKPTITYYAWDGTSGQNGGTADLSQAGATGGTTAYSLMSDTAVLNVNDAPVLTAASPSLGSTTANVSKTISLTGTFINNGTAATTITDVDTNAVVGGIAVTGTAGKGTWSYSLDGTTFHNIGTVSSTSALLLPKTASLRYSPDGSDTETATITYCAWDTTSGAAGATADTTTNGGTTAFSTATDTASLTVTAAIQRPLLAAASPSLGTTTANTAKTVSLSGSFINNGTRTTTITDANAGSVVGGIAVTGTTGKGTWVYSLNGTTFTAVGTVSSTAALLLPKTASLRYTPDGTDAETPTITYLAWDTTGGAAGATADTTTSGTTAFSTASDTASLAVTATASGSLSGYVYVATQNGGQWTSSSTCISGVTIRLFLEDSSGNWNEVSGKSPVQTAGNGFYSFSGLAAGAYQIRETASSEFIDGTATAGTLGGTTAQDQVQVQLGAGQSASGNNFSVQGLPSQLLSLRSFMASTPALNIMFQQLHTAPSIDLAGTGTAGNYSGTFSAGGAPAAIAASTATITSPESPTLVSLTATITNPQDAGETLSAVTTNTGLTATFAGDVLTVFGVADLSVYQTLLQSITYSDSQSSPQSTPRTINVVVNDGTSDSAAATTTMTIVSAPTGYTITADHSLINSAAASAAGFTFAGATVGDTYKYTVSSSGGGSPVTGSGTVSSASQDVTAVNVSSLSDGTLTYSATLTDTAGHTGGAVTATATLDQTAPAGYTITVNTDLIGKSGADSTGFTFAGADVGDSYNYTVSSSGGGSVVTGSGSVTAADQDITGINVSTLADGTLTYSVTLTDTAGNTGTAATATATLDQTAPTGYGITANDNPITASTAASTGFTFGNAEVGDSFSYDISSSGGGTAVAGGGTVTTADQKVTGINVSSLPNGILTYSVTLTDKAGNVGAAATTTATLNQTVPTGYTITLDESAIDNDNAATAGFTLGEAEVGATYNYSVVDGAKTLTGSGTVTAATQDIPGINVAMLPNGTLTYTVTLTNTVGAGTPQSATAILNQTTPAGYSITADAATIGNSNAGATGFTFSGAEVGATYNYTVNDDAGGTPLTGTGTITSATQDIKNINLTALPNGNITYSVTLTNGAGEGSAETATTVLSQTAPSGFTIQANNNPVTSANAASTGFIFSGAVVGDTYSYTVTSSGGSGSVMGTGTVTSAAQKVTGINVVPLHNGTLTYSVTLGNGGGTSTPVTTTATLSQAAPAGYGVTPDATSITSANVTSTGFKLSGAEIGATYNYTISSNNGGTQVKGSGTVSSATQDITGINLAMVPNGILTYSVTLSNGAGAGTAATNNTATLNQAVPVNYTVTANDATVDNSNAASTGFTIAAAEVGVNFSYTVTSSGGGLQLSGNGKITTSTQKVTGINVVGMTNGTLTYSVILTNGFGSSDPITGNATLIQTVPANYSITADAGTITNANAGSTGFTFAGAEVGAAYNYTITSSGAGGAASVTGSGTVTAANQDITGIDVAMLANGTLTYSVTLSNKVGAGSPEPATATLNQTAPAGYAITADDNPITNANVSTTGFTFSGAEVGAAYTYTVTDSASQTTLTGTGSVTSANQDVKNINLALVPHLSGLPNGTLTYSVTLTNGVGAGIAAPATTVLNQTAPGTLAIQANDNPITSVNATSTGFTFAGAGVGDTYSYTITSSGGGLVTGTGLVTSAAEKVTGINVVGLHNGILSYSVTLSNGAGSTAPATTTATLSQTAPGTFSVAADAGSVTNTNAASTGFTFTGAEVGATYAYTITSSGTGGTPVTGSGKVASANQDITGINVLMLPNGTLTFSVTLTNGGGTTGPQKATATINQAIPANYTVTAKDLTVDNSNAGNTGFTIAGGEVGATFSYTVSSSGGAATLSGSGTITAGSQPVTGINVVGLANGTLAYSVKLTNGVGSSNPITGNATLNQTVPADYHITADAATITNANAASAGFTFSGAEVGATYSYTVTTDGGAASVTGGGTVTSANQDVTGVNVAMLQNGNLLYSVTLTNGIGTGNPATATAAINQAVPSGFTITPDANPVLATEASSTGFTLSGAEVGTAYYYSVTSPSGNRVTGTGTIAAATEDITGIDVSAFPDGHLTYSVTLTNGAGTSFFNTATFTLDTSAAAVIALSGSSVGGNQAAGTKVGALSMSGKEVGNTQSFSLVSGTGSDDNASFTIVGNQLQTSVPLNPQTKSSYAIRVAGVTDYLASDVVDETGVSSPQAYQVTYTPTLMPGSTAISQLAAAGELFLGSNTSGTWVNAVTADSGAAGSLAQTNYQGGYSAFWSSVTAAHPSAALKDVLGSWGVDTTNNAVWAVVDYSGQFAAEVQVAAQQTFTLAVRTAPPSGYSIAVDAQQLTTATAGSTGFTLTNAEPGATYAYTITSSGSGGTGSVTGSGLVNSAVEDVTGIDVSTLPDGVLTYSVVLTNGAGSGAAATDKAYLNVAPAAGAVDIVLAQTDNWLNS
ncbi:MAG: peptidylprolyl isomerase [Thermoguttaceae bacterium]